MTRNSSKPYAREGCALPSELLAQVRRIEIMTDRLVTETFAGEYLSVFKGRGMEFTEVREYSPGDDIRTIDWNVTARMGKPFVKRFTEERELTAIVACDLSGSQAFGSRGRLKKEIAAEIAAVLAFSALQNNDKVGLFLFTEDIEEYVPPKKGRKHVLHLIRDLLAFAPTRSGTRISRCLETMVRVLKRSSILFLISDFREDLQAAEGLGPAPGAKHGSAPDFSEDFLRTLRLASMKHDIVPIIITDPRERALPKYRACIELEDPESGARTLFDASDAANLSALKRWEEGRLANAEKAFALLGLEWIRIDTDKPPIDPIVRFFQRRAKRMRR
ncbi:MAG: DUF58 domain-containing protein [Elusimicrobia bacterium]|nr:DUF58 domain-containing protein [Elusimicrobiota bacterium]